MCVPAECRELSERREDRSLLVQSLSSAKLTLQGILTTAKVLHTDRHTCTLSLSLQGFGLVTTEPQKQLISQLEDEYSKLQRSLSSLQTHEN